MIQWIVKILFKQIFKAIMRRREWKRIDKYVNKPNELDIQTKQLQKIQRKQVSYIEDIQKDLANLKGNSHPPVFAKKDYDNILKRLRTLEKRRK